MDVKQVIIVRKDLKMRLGKSCAQASHASMLGLLNFMSKTDKGDKAILNLDYDKSSAIGEWLEGSFTKICLACNSEEELDELYNKAKSLGLPVVMIIDNGLTEFNGVKTKTCIAIGPALKEDIDKVTSYLTPL